MISDCGTTLRPLNAPLSTVHSNTITTVSFSNCTDVTFTSMTGMGGIMPACVQQLIISYLVTVSLNIHLSPVYTWVLNRFGSQLSFIQTGLGYAAIQTVHFKLA